MQKTIYKWGKYYLMYSPVWKQLTQHKTIYFQALINQPITSNLNHTPPCFQGLHPIQQLCMKTHFNHRLSIAYSILLHQGSTLSLKHSLKGLNDPDPYWKLQRQRIARKVKQVIQQLELNLIISSSTPLVQKNKAVNQLFELAVSSNVPKPASQTDRQYFAQKQQQIKQQQLIHQVDEIKKRILIKEVLSLISQDSLMSKTQTPTFQNRHMNVSNLKSEITNHTKRKTFQKGDKVLLMQVIVHLVQQLFVQKGLYFQQEQMHDWIATLFRQNRILQIISVELLKNLEWAVFPNTQDELFSQNDISNMVSVFWQMKELVNCLQIFCHSDGKIANETNLQQIQSFIKSFDKLSSSQFGILPQPLCLELQRIQALQQSLKVCDQVSSGKANLKGLIRVIKPLYSFNISNRDNHIPFRLTRPQSFTIQFNLWKFHLLIRSMIKLDQLPASIQVDISSQKSHIRKYLQNQISSLLQAISKSTRIKTSKNLIIYELSQSIQLAAVCDFLMIYQPKISLQQTELRKFRTSISPHLKKIKQPHIKHIFNHKFQSQPINHILQTLKKISQVKLDKIIDQNKFSILKQTQLLSNLFRTLHKLILKQKQHIILSSSEKIQLAKNIEFLSQHRYSSQIFGQQQRELMEKILEKIKP